MQADERHVLLVTHRASQVTGIAYDKKFLPLFPCSAGMQEGVDVADEAWEVVSGGEGALAACTVGAGAAQKYCIPSFAPRQPTPFQGNTLVPIWMLAKNTPGASGPVGVRKPLLLESLDLGNSTSLTLDSNQVSLSTVDSVMDRHSAPVVFSSRDEAGKPFLHADPSIPGRCALPEKMVHQAVQLNREFMLVGSPTLMAVRVSRNISTELLRNMANHGKAFCVHQAVTDWEYPPTVKALTNQKTVHHSPYNIYMAPVWGEGANEVIPTIHVQANGNVVLHRGSRVEAAEEYSAVHMEKRFAHSALTTRLNSCTRNLTEQLIAWFLPWLTVEEGMEVLAFTWSNIFKMVITSVSLLMNVEEKGTLFSLHIPSLRTLGACIRTWYSSPANRELMEEIRAKEGLDIAKLASAMGWCWEQMANGLSIKDLYLLNVCNRFTVMLPVRYALNGYKTGKVLLNFCYMLLSVEVVRIIQRHIEEGYIEEEEGEGEGRDMRREGEEAFAFMQRLFSSIILERNSFKSSMTKSRKCLSGRKTGDELRDEVLLAAKLLFPPKCNPYILGECPFVMGGITGRLQQEFFVVTSIHEDGYVLRLRANKDGGETVEVWAKKQEEVFHVGQSALFPVAQSAGIQSFPPQPELLLSQMPENKMGVHLRRGVLCVKAEPGSSEFCTALFVAMANLCKATPVEYECSVLEETRVFQSKQPINLGGGMLMHPSMPTLPPTLWLSGWSSPFYIPCSRVPDEWREKVVQWAVSQILCRKQDFGLVRRQVETALVQLGVMSSKEFGHTTLDTNLGPLRISTSSKRASDFSNFWCSFETSIPLSIRPVKVLVDKMGFSAETRGQAPEMGKEESDMPWFLEEEEGEEDSASFPALTTEEGRKQQLMHDAMYCTHMGVGFGTQTQLAVMKNEEEE